MSFWGHDFTWVLGHLMTRLSFLKCFHWICWIQWKNICHYRKRARIYRLLHYRPGCYHSASKTHVRDRIFKLTPIHASVINQIPWIHWISVPFRDNSTRVFPKWNRNSVNSANSENLIITEAWIGVSLKIMSLTCVLQTLWQHPGH